MESNQDLPIKPKTKSTQASDPLRANCAVYEQLPVNESRTRVLVLHSSLSNSAPVSCSLEVVTLKPEPSSAYTALSYVWGDASVTQEILVNGVPFAVTANLVSALRHVYGLLGLFDLDIVPDYGENKTVADVYLDLARHCLKIEHQLTILSLAGTKHICHGSDCSTAHLDLPSWVPDWTLPSPARVRLPRYHKSYAFPSDGGLQMQIIDDKWLRGSAVVWDRVSRTEYKAGWDLTEWDLVERIDIKKPGDRAYPSGITRFQAIIILWLGGYDESKGSQCDLQPGSDLFQSYEIIFFANIVQPWVTKHGRSERTKLVHHVVGGSKLISRPTSIPKGVRQAYVARSRQLRYGMRCFHTDRGYIGLGPLNTEVGQLVRVLKGHKAPVLLERKDSHYLFVGDCDVVGIMNGEVLEAVKRGEAETREIEIR